FPVEATTYVIKTKVPFNRVTLLKQARVGPAKQWQGKEYYPLPEARRKTPAYMIVPTESIVVVTMLPADQLGTIFKLPGDKPSIAPEALATLRAIDRSHAWLVAPPEPVKANLPSGGLLSIPPLVDAMVRSKGVGISMRFQSEFAHVTLALTMADGAVGKEVA